MYNWKKIIKKSVLVTVLILSLATVSACGTTASAIESTETTGTTSNTENGNASETAETAGDNTEGSSSDATAQGTAGTTSSTATVTLDTSDMFTDRDLDASYEESSTITLADNGTTSDNKSVSVSGNTVTITAEGTYVVSGSLTDGMIIIDAADTDKVQLVLDGVSINSATSAAIYVKTADKVFVTLADGTENTLSNGGTFTAIDDNNIDAVIFSKADLTCNGTGSVTITSPAGHGIVSKDDLVVTAGTYAITASGHGLAGKDSVRIADGDFMIKVDTDGIHAANSDDTSLGYLYIAGGTFNIEAGDDGMHAETTLLIDDGDINIAKSYEGIEGTDVTIAGGTIAIVSSDDGINAAESSSSSATNTDIQQNRQNMSPNTDTTTEETDGADESGMTTVSMTMTGKGDMNGMGGGMSSGNATLTISGGTVTVNAEGDGLDANGSILISGGTTIVWGPTNSGNGTIDYDSTAVITGGTFVGTGVSGMAENFSSSSTQGVMMISVGDQTAGSEITLLDADSQELLSETTEKAYNVIMFSCSDLTVGESYTVSVDDTDTAVTMDSLVYSNVTGGMGGGMNGGMNGNMGGGKNGRMQ